MSMRGISGIKLLAGCAIVSAALLAAPATAAVFSVNYDDSGNFGFRDGRAAQPVAGNTATTRGGQRRAVMEAALAIWASRLDTALTIRIGAEFDDLGCGEETTLGLGGPTWLGRGGSLPQQNTHYPGTMVAALTGNGFDDADADIRVTFNVRLDDGDCVDDVSGYWYGLDPEIPPAPGTFSFLELVLHEIGHGLGFTSLTNRETREFIEIQGESFPDVMSQFIFDLDQDKTWQELTAAQRVTSAVAGTSLTFSGPRANDRAAERLLPPGLITASAPILNVSQFQAFFHGSPPYLPLAGLNAPIRLADSDNPGESVEIWDRNLACEPLTNSEAIAGNIALVYRGECTFSTKVQNVTNAGGIGIIIVDNQPTLSDNAIDRDGFMAFAVQPTIPVYSVRRQQGTTLRSGTGGGRTYTLGYNLALPPRGTRDGLMNLFSDPENASSSVSHFSNRMMPRSLMNPSVTNTASTGDLDFVPEFMHDLGWPDNRPKLTQYSGNWFKPERAGEGCQLTLEQGNEVPVLTCYMYRDGEQFWLIGPGQHMGDRYEFNEMIVTSGADYGSAFRPEDVVRENWGRITMRLRDCNTARFEFRPEAAQGLLPFTTQMEKIVAFDCNQRASQQPQRSRDGNYLARDGEGIQLAFEPDANRWVLTWYTYKDGAQIWTVGSAPADGDLIDFDEMIITRGGDWGVDLDASQVELDLFGRIQVEFLDNCNDVNVTIDPALSEFEPSQYVMTRIVPREC